jgi:2-polyprenyl-3-methyl-5-hydroxy-6-metoxy-1,4-benzoquinol methylase
MARCVKPYPITTAPASQRAWKEFTMQRAQQFWDDIFANHGNVATHRVDIPDPTSPHFKRAVEHFGDVRGKTLIDVGCGSGASSLFFSSLGANVISVDLSDVAIDNLKRYCTEQRITNITPVALAAQQIASLGEVDFVFGSMILHHIEPFAQFAQVLRHATKPGGRAFFFENNGRSNAMMWFRDHVIGKFGIPKYGDVDESPLAPGEIDELRKHFNVLTEFPEMIYVQMASLYLLRGFMQRHFVSLDQYLGRYPSLRKFSYRQYICLR